MRLLFLTNFYPPTSRGGYELWCQEVAERLGRCGHEIVVLTSRSKPRSKSSSRSVTVDSSTGLRVARELYLEMEIDSARNVPTFFLDRTRRARANIACAQRWLDTLDPDFVVIWGMWNLNRSLPAFVEQVCGERTVYYFGDYWPTLPDQWQLFWRAPARSRLSRAGKWFLKKPAERLLKSETRPMLSFPHALFPSDFMRQSYEDASIRVGQSRVVLGGVPTEAYREEAQGHLETRPPQDLRVLVAGRLTPEKGIHTAVEAIRVLADRHPKRRCLLTIVGAGEGDYPATLKELAVRLGVADCVRFSGPVPSDAMPGLFREHDVFVFPSTWDEPFGRVLVEAMAAGVPVVGTTVGGAGEILHDGETGLTFAPGDALGLANQLARLVGNPWLLGRLAKQAHARALANFDAGRMAREIEAYLEEISATHDGRSRRTSREVTAPQLVSSAAADC